MKQKTIKLVELENGDIVLKDSKSTNEPLLRLSFSKTVENMLQENKLEVVRVMLEAGIDRHQEIVLAQEDNVGALEEFSYGEYVH